MNDVSFHEEQTYERTPVAQSQSGLSRFLIDKGFAKDAASAQRIMLGMVAICILIIGLLIYQSRSNTPEIPQETIEAALPR